MDPSQQNRPLLHTSCLLGDQENVLRLLSANVDVNELDFAGCTAIQLAAAAGHLNIVKILVQNGAKPEIQDSTHGNTCLHESSWRGFSTLVKLLCNPKTMDIQNQGGFTPLHLSCQAGHNQSTRELLLAGASPNLVNTYGDTPLHTSVRYGHAGVCRILLSARADNDPQNKNGDTALHISAAMHRKKLTKILLSSGCNPNLRNNQNETPLDICERKGFEDVIHVIKHPPNILTPMQRDEMRASKFKINSHPQQTQKQAAGLLHTSNATSSSVPPTTTTMTSTSLTLKQQISSLFSNKSGSRKSLANQSSSQLSPKHSTNSSSNKVNVDEHGCCNNKMHKGSSGNGRCESAQSCCHNQNAAASCSGSKGSKNNSSANLHEKHVPGCSSSSNKEMTKGKVNVLNGNVDVVNDDVSRGIGWSPYGCHHGHYHPNPAPFPKPNIDSLPKEPLRTGELYYLDLAGNIHKGPRGKSECYCNTMLSQTQGNSQSMLALNNGPNSAKVVPKRSSRHHHRDGDHIHRHDRHVRSSRHELESVKDEDLDPEHGCTNPPLHVIGKGTKYEDQLKRLTSQLSKIHMDTQAQLTSLHSMLNERLTDKDRSSSRLRQKRHRQHDDEEEDKDSGDELPEERDENDEDNCNDQGLGEGVKHDGDEGFNARRLKEWVKHYRRFRKEISKNPKMLHQANELLASASALLSTRLPSSPPPADSETDSGL